MRRVVQRWTVERMAEKYKEKDLRELYRIDNKYWKTGDVDILPKRLQIAMSISERFWDKIAATVSIATQKHLPIQNVIDALKLLGFEKDEEEKQ